MMKFNHFLRYPPKNSFKSPRLVEVHDNLPHIVKILLQLNWVGFILLGPWMSLHSHIRHPSHSRCTSKCDAPRRGRPLRAPACVTVTMPALVLAARRQMRMAFWDAPLCHRRPKNSSSVSCGALRRVWRSELNCYWAKPSRNRGPTVPRRQAHPTARADTHTHTHTHGNV